MKFSLAKHYKVTECADCLVVGDADTTVTNMPGARELVIADGATVLTYLDRYFFEREHGEGYEQAHKAASATARDTVRREFLG